MTNRKPRVWYIISIILILLDPLLAHLSNASMVSWPAWVDNPDVTRIVSRLLIGGGILSLLIGLTFSFKEGYGQK